MSVRFEDGHAAHIAARVAEWSGPGWQEWQGMGYVLGIAFVIALVIVVLYPMYRYEKFIREVDAENKRNEAEWYAGGCKGAPPNEMRVS